MKITDIKQQAKRADRYSIYVDEKYAFSLSDSELLNLGLHVGQEFGAGELEDLKDKAVLDKAYDRALNLIARRPRSRWTYPTSDAPEGRRATVSLTPGAPSTRGGRSACSRSSGS